jgi:hypothetical protein
MACLICDKACKGAHADIVFMAKKFRELNDSRDEKAYKLAVLMEVLKLMQVPSRHVRRFRDLAAGGTFNTTELHTITSLRKHDRDVIKHALAIKGDLQT